MKLLLSWRTSLLILIASSPLCCGFQQFQSKLSIVPTRNVSSRSATFSSLSPNVARKRNIHFNAQYTNKYPSLTSLYASPAIVATKATECTYFLTRILFLRALGFVSFVAFMVALRQNKALIGDDGISPGIDRMEAAQEMSRYKRNLRLRYFQREEEMLLRKKDEQSGQNNGSLTSYTVSDDRDFNWKTIVKRTKFAKWIHKTAIFQYFLDHFWNRQDRLGRPLISMLWLLMPSPHDKDAARNTESNKLKINPWIDRIAYLGLLCSFFLLFSGVANVPILLTLWLCQRSLMSIGGVFYGYGWVSSHFSSN